MFNLKDLLKTKTFWAGVTGLIAACGGYMTGDITGGAAIQTALTAIMGIFIRDALTKNP